MDLKEEYSPQSDRSIYLLTLGNLGDRRPEEFEPSISKSWAFDVA